MNSIAKRVELGLQVLLENSGDGWFLIFEEPVSEKFVQFAYDEGQELVFDCPTMAFSPDELKKAIEVMQRFNIKHSHPAGDDFASFTSSVGLDVNLARNAALAMLTEVFGFDDQHRLDITINR